MKQRFMQAAAAALLLAGMPAAHALPALSLSVDGGTAFVCSDGAACDNSGVAGVVSINQMLGDFLVNITTGLSKPFLTGGNPLMDLSTVNVQVWGGSHTLEIKFSDTDFDLYGGRFVMAYGGTLSGAGSFEHSAYYDAGNDLFGTDSLMGQVAYGSGAFSGLVDGGWSPGGPYSVTEILTLRTAGGLTVFSGDFEVKVPEPATLALLGLGLFLFGAVRMRRTVRVRRQAG
jgi:hypothetical protein